MFRDDPLEDEALTFERLQSHRCASTAGGKLTLVTAPGLQESSVYCLRRIHLGAAKPRDVGLYYIEVCLFCCRPIEFHLREQAGGWLEAEVRSDVE